MDRKYRVVEYVDVWTEAFKREEKILRRIFGDEILEIHHVGSTSVHGLVGKPTLDVMIIVRDLSKVDPLNKKMEAVGYESIGAYVTSTSRLFVKNKDAERTHNIHVFQKGDLKAAETLDFRDYLRSHPEEAKAYGDLKKELAAQHPDDYFVYRKKKDSFLREIHERMRKWNDDKIASRPKSGRSDDLS